MRKEEFAIWEKLKKSYQIPVPDSAKSNIIAGIQRAKREKRRDSAIRTIRNTGIGAAAAMLTLTIAVNTNETVANAMENIPVIGALAKVVTFRTYENRVNDMEADITIPQIDSGNGTEIAVNQSINDYAQSLIAQYEVDVAQSQGEGHYQLSSTYDVVTDDANYLSIRIQTTVVMASGTQYVKIFTVDKVSGEVVTLQQIFQDTPNYIEIISNNIKEQMKAQMAADDSKMYFLDTEIPEINFKKITGDESFYFNKDGELVLAFDEYTVAPGYMGAVEFTIPKGILK